MILEVEATRNHDGESTPTAFKLGSRRLAVSDIVDRWLANDHSYFKVIADDGAVYILRHNKLVQSWEMTLFSRHSTG
jgi:hypothetical protein